MRKQALLSEIREFEETQGKVRQARYDLDDAITEARDFTKREGVSEMTVSLKNTG